MLDAISYFSVKNQWNTHCLLRLTDNCFRVYYWCNFYCRKQHENFIFPSLMFASSISFMEGYFYCYLKLIFNSRKKMYFKYTEEKWGRSWDCNHSYHRTFISSGTCDVLILFYFFWEDYWDIFIQHFLKLNTLLVNCPHVNLYTYMRIWWFKSWK